jgi:hypothetical protein
MIIDRCIESANIAVGCSVNGLVRGIGSACQYNLFNFPRVGATVSSFSSMPYTQGEELLLGEKMVKPMVVKMTCLRMMIVMRIH